MYSVEEEVSSILRRMLLSLEDMRSQHQQADSPLKVQQRMEDVLLEFERLTYAYEVKQGIEF
jgi:plasmid stability protein